MSDRLPTAVMVLAAGRGERMRPLSDVLPKPALPLPDGPVVASALRLARAIGAVGVTVNVWHLADRMESALTRARMPCDTIAVSRETALMGTAGGLALARERGLLGSEGPVLVANGDSLYDLAIGPLLERFATSNDLVSLGLIPHPNPDRWSRVLLRRDGRVAAIRPARAPASGEAQPYHFPGVMVVAREALDAIPVSFGSTPERLWEPARRSNRLGAAALDGSWHEVGTPADYLAAVRHLLGGRCEIDPRARVATTEVASSMIGEGVRVEASSEIRDSVIAHGARVGSGARVLRSVLLGPVEISDSELVENEVRVADW